MRSQIKKYVLCNSRSKRKAPHKMRKRDDDNMARMKMIKNNKTSNVS